MSHWLIAGASRGIGLELARQLAARGERVTASVRSETGRARLAEALGAAGGKGRILTFDTRNDAQIRAAAAQVSEPIDVLIANAGAYGPQRQSTLEMDFDGVLDLLNTNTLGPLRVVQAFLPLLRRSASPRIVMMSSVLGSMALEGTFNVGYRASKAGLNKIAQCLADDLGPAGVAVISLHPGWVRTDMGGPNATLAVAESAAGVIKVAERLTLSGTRRYLDYRGAEIDW
jgi:NAD(P)-dependent dehydrogenase (short-subunit alcohol dehydrogenase family)